MMSTFIFNQSYDAMALDQAFVNTINRANSQPLSLYRGDRSLSSPSLPSPLLPSLSIEQLAVEAVSVRDNDESNGQLT